MQQRKKMFTWDGRTELTQRDAWEMTNAICHGLRWTTRVTMVISYGL